MTDLETRLRADAAREDVPPPDLDLMLTRAVEPRRRHRPLVAAAAAVLVVASGTAVLAARHAARSGPAAGSDGPVTASVVAVSPHPERNQLVVYVQVRGAKPDCVWAPVTATEDATSVHLHAEVRRSDRAHGTCGVSPYVAGYVSLHAPIGTRRVVDDASSRPVPVLDGHNAPVPAHLPAGAVAGRYECYQDVIDRGQPTRGCGSGPTSSVVADDWLGALGPASSRAYLWPSRSRPGRVLLTVSVATTPELTAGWRVVDESTVSGHRAVVSQTDAADKCVSWEAAPGRALQVCATAVETLVPLTPSEASALPSDVRARRGVAGRVVRTPVDTDTLLGIARSIP